MKKIYLTEREEITIQKIHQFVDYVEQNFTIFLDEALQMSSGVLTGLSVTQNGASGVLVSSGVIIQNSLFGELEGSSGLVVSLPVSGTRTDLVVASYQAILDTPGSGMVMVNTTTRLKEVQTNPTRNFGSVKIEIVQNTPVSGVPSGKILVASLSLASSGIVSIDNDVKKIATFKQRQTFTFADVTSAKAYASFVHGDILNILDKGYYVYDETSASISDDLFVITPNSLPGRILMSAPHIDVVYDYLMDEINGLAAKQITAFKTADIASIAANSGTTVTGAVSGAVVGDAVSIGLPSTHNDGVIVTGRVSAADTVTLVFRNVTAGAIDLANATYQITVLKY